MVPRGDGNTRLLHHSSPRRHRQPSIRGTMGSGNRRGWPLVAASNAWREWSRWCSPIERSRSLLRQGTPRPGL